MKKKNLAIALLTLTAITPVIASCGGNDQPKEDDPVVDQQTQEDTEKVIAALDALSVTTLATSNFELKVKGSGNVAITWTSNNTNVITVDGATAKVKRPGFGQEDATVTLTATAVSGSITKTKTFDVKVTAMVDESKTVAELKALDDDTTAYAKGVVTGFLYGGDNETPYGYYLTDATGTFYIYGSNNAATVAVGNEVYVSGKIGSYSGAKQFVSDETIVLQEAKDADFTAVIKKDTDAGFKEVYDLGKNAVGNVYEFLAQVYVNSYGAYSIEPVDYDTYAVSMGEYYSGSSSTSFTKYASHLRGKEGQVVRVLFYANSVNSSNKLRGNVLAVKELTEADYEVAALLETKNAVKLSSLYTADAEIALPTTFGENYADFTVEYSVKGTGAVIEDNTLKITAGDTIQDITVTTTATKTVDYDVYTAVDKEKVTAPVADTDYYTLADGVYTKAEGLTAWAADTTYYTLGHTLTYTSTDICSAIKASAINCVPLAEALAGVASGDVVMSKGVITNIDDKGNVYLSDGTNVFQFYGLSDGSVVKLADLKVGQYVEFIGTYDKVWNGYPETKKNTVNVLLSRAATEAEKVDVTGGELAFADQFADVENVELATKGTTFEAATITWAVKGGNCEACEIVDGKMNINRGTSDVSVTVVATVKVGETTKEFESTFTVYSIYTVKAAYTASTSTSLTADTINNDYAEALGLDATKFEVKFTKNSAGYTALYTNSIRLYGNTKGGNAMTVTAKEGYTIKSATIVYDTSVTGAVPVVNGVTKEAVSTTHTTDVVEVNASSLTIVNDKSTKNQLRIAYILIVFEAVEATE